MSLVGIEQPLRLTDMETKKIYGPNDLQPSVAIHPGEMLKDELEARGVSQRKFASMLEMSYSVLNEMLNCKRPITTECALKIEAATSIPAYIWVDIQKDYDIQMARKDKRLSSVLEKIRKAAAVF